MAAVAAFLVDKSALVRLRHPQVAQVLAPLIEAGYVATCAMVDFEMLWSTRSASEYETVRQNRDVGYEWLPIEDLDWRRALDVQGELWALGKPRSVPLPDLLIAAVAERNRVAVVHYDADYDLIGEITGQPTLWVVPRGSVS